MQIILDVIAGAALSAGIAALTLSLRHSPPSDRPCRRCLAVGLSVGGAVLLGGLVAQVGLVAIAFGSLGLLVSLQTLAVRHVFARRTLRDYAALSSGDETPDEPAWWPEFEAQFAEACRAHVRHRDEA